MPVPIWLACSPYRSSDSPMSNASSPTASPFLQGIRGNLKRQRQAQAILPDHSGRPAPLTLAQERLWQLDRLQPGNSAHTQRALWRLSGPLNLTAFTQSLAEIARRHAILRTTFPAIDGRPVQQVAAEPTLTLAVTDLRPLAPAAQPQEVERLAASAAQQPFDLVNGPLLRCHLLRLGDGEAILLRTIHHIITDAWSDSVFLRELAAFYQALAVGEPPILPDLPIQYADFARWQRLQGDEFDRQRAYWRSQLDPAPALLQLPVDYLPAAPLRYAGSAEYRTLPPELVQRVGLWSQAQGVSPFTTLLAAFKTLLYLYSGQEDLLVCSPLAGRSHPETQRLIGYFSTLVLLRTRLEPTASFQQLVTQVGHTVTEAFEHQDLALQEVATAASLPGALLSRAMFALQNMPAQPTHLADVQIERVDIEEEVSNFDLSLSLRKLPDTLRAVLRYKRDLFSQETMHQLLANYEALLVSLLAQPEQRLAELPRLAAPPSPTSLSREDGARSPHELPQNAQEQMLLALWQEVLHQDRISVHDNFFTLGGGSLAFVQLCHQLQTRLGRQVALNTLLAAPTIRGMAACLQQDGAAEQQETSSLQERTLRQKAALQQQRVLRSRKPNHD